LPKQESIIHIFSLLIQAIEKITSECISPNNQLVADGKNEESHFLYKNLEEIREIHSILIILKDKWQALQISGIDSSVLDTPVPKENIQDESEIGFSEHDKQILDLLRQGMTNKKIAESMDLSEGTTRNLISRLFKKLEVNNRV